MPDEFDSRLLELKLLQSIGNGVWRNGVCLALGAGQLEALDISQREYADLLLTMFEEGFLSPESDGIRNEVRDYQVHRTVSSRRQLVLWISVQQPFFDVAITYRGRRHIEELREQLRRDRVLEKFGILLDGRHIVSDLIYFLERANGEPVSLILADVDDFKKFNTDHGYKAGDEVLRQVFRIFRDMVADRGEVYRRGGEEIIALLPYCSDSACLDLAERVRQSIDNTTIGYEGTSLHATVSIGVATSPPCDADGPAIESHAEIGLKRAKDEGKNCVRKA